MSLKERWSSSLAFITVATGAAVGLGSIWKIPYEIGRQGGGAFVLLYLLFVFILGIPLMISEMSIGILGRNDPIGSLKGLSAKYHALPGWVWLGRLSLITLMFILSFYSVVAGWDFDYLLWFIRGGFVQPNPLLIQAHWQELMSSPLRLILYHTLFLLLTMSVVIWPIQKGIERASKIMMPTLFIVLLILDLYSMFLPGRDNALAYLFQFRWQEISFDVMVSALGNALFTLAVGAGCMLVYAAYLPKNTKVVGLVFTIAFFDALVALMSGFAIFSIVFSSNLNPDSGPGLMFLTMPVAFSKMAYGVWLGLGFFVLLLFAAWTSSISLLEPLVAFAISHLKWSRKYAVIIMGLVVWVLGILSALSFNVLAGWSVFGMPNFFEWISYLTTNVFLLIGGLGYAIFVGWKIPIKDLRRAILTNESIFYIWYKTVQYILPAWVLFLLFKEVA